MEAMLDTLELYEELAAALTPDAAKVLANAMGKLYREIAATVTKEEFGELKAVVADLADAQNRTENRVGELAEAQKRTEARIEELAEAQKRTEVRVEELAEAQKRTEDEVRKLAKGLRETRQMVGGLSDTVGYVLEDRAIRSLPDLLPDRVGVTVEGSLKRTYIEHPDGRTSELNVFGSGTNARGETVSILGEAKSRLGKKHVDEFVKLAARLEKDGLLKGDPLLILIAYSVDPRTERYAKNKGILIIPSYELVP
jgi:uncharacterized protein YukE